MKRWLYILMPWIWLLAGCADRVQYVYVPQPVLCQINVGQEPSYPDTVSAIQAQKDIFGRVQLLLAGRVGRDQRLKELQALKKCALPVFGE